MVRRVLARLLSGSLVLAGFGPLYLLAKQAITPELESFAWPPFWLPHRLTAAHLRAVFALSELRSVLARSLAVAALSAVLATALGAMLGYAMARGRRERAAGLGLISVTRLLPMIAVAIPLALALIVLGLYDTQSGIGLALVHGAVALPTAVLTSFSGFAGLPVELEEAAWLDGAGPLRAFFSVVLPAVRPFLAATFILTFLLSWDEFGFALLIQVTHRTLPPLLYYYTVFGDVGPASALALVMLLPAIAVVVMLRPMLGQTTALSALPGGVAPGERRDA
ncbi:MAG: carbohydrate ABC transporter permease [Deltaproteobacteria bacterium]|jgi:ABC-type glycerol-3-phosphate transport system permease component|nr:carbohydrate ABC transporter permease [Deltaproteobacteria bacterium]